MTVGELLEQLKIASEVEDVVIVDEADEHYRILAVTWVNFKVRIRVRKEE